MKTIEDILNQAIEKIKSGEIEKEGPIQANLPYELNISNICYIAQGLIEGKIEEKSQRNELWDKLMEIEKLLD